ncbi:ribosome maturation factor RimM [Desulfatiferula olefinivorans]
MAGNDYILIGKVSGIHGLHGNLKVYSYAESTDLYEPGIPLVLRPSSAPERPVTVRSAKPYKKGLLLTVDGIDDISAAEPFKGADILIARHLLPEPDEDEYYWFDIIGLAVVSVDGQALGVVESIFPTGSNDVYVVRNRNEERLIPALESVIVGIDLDSGVMTVNLPEGL